MHPIVLLHGFPLDGEMWKLQAEFLRSLGHTVLTPNLPGFGGPGGTPPLPRDGSTMEAFAGEVRQLILREAGGKAVVGGFSMGGYVLLALLREHPECVAAAMFIDTRAEADSAEARAGRLKSIDDVTREGTTTKVVEGMVAKVMAKKPSPAVKEQVRTIMQRQTPEAVICALSAMSARRDQTDLLATLKLPVLIIVGAEDAVTPPSVALGMQSHMAHAMLAQAVSAGHMAPMEQPASVNSTIHSFLATVHPPAARTAQPV